MTGKERLLLTGGKLNRAFFHQALALSGESNQHVLIDRTASMTDAYFTLGQALAAKLLADDFKGIAVDHLQQARYHRPSHHEAQEKIAQADVLVVGGGNTRQLHKRWQEFGILNLVTERVANGELVGCGGGAGALIWFDHGQSDAESYDPPLRSTWRYTTLPFSGVLPGVAAVHYSDIDELGRDRGLSYRKSLQASQGLWRSAIALDTDAAVMIYDGIAEVAQLGEDYRGHAYGFFMARGELGYHKYASHERIGSLCVADAKPA